MILEKILTNLLEANFALLKPVKTKLILFVLKPNVL